LDIEGREGRARGWHGLGDALDALAVGKRRSALGVGLLCSTSGFRWRMYM
jgi:hypothetical protein